MLRGIEPVHLKQLVETALPTIIELMCDPSVSVRDTAAWTVGQICENIPETAINPMYLEGLLQAMVFGLKSEPRVAANVCWAFVELAKASYAAVTPNDNDEPETYCLSQYFSHLVDSLLEVTNRPDGNQVQYTTLAKRTMVELKSRFKN
jgi:importin subunit beta-1